MRCDITQNDVLTLAEAGRKSRVEGLKHVELGLERFGFVDVVHVVATPTKELFQGVASHPQCRFLALGKSSEFLLGSPLR